MQGQSSFPGSASGSSSSSSVNQQQIYWDDSMNPAAALLPDYKIADVTSIQYNSSNLVHLAIGESPSSVAQNAAIPHHDWSSSLVQSSSIAANQMFGEQLLHVINPSSTSNHLSQVHPQPGFLSESGTRHSFPANIIHNSNPNSSSASSSDRSRKRKSSETSLEQSPHGQRDGSQPILGVDASLTIGIGAPSEIAPSTVRARLHDHHHHPWQNQSSNSPNPLLQFLPVNPSPPLFHLETALPSPGSQQRILREQISSSPGWQAYGGGAAAATPVPFPPAYMQYSQGTTAAVQTMATPPSVRSRIPWNPYMRPPPPPSSSSPSPSSLLDRHRNALLMLPSLRNNNASDRRRLASEIRTLLEVVRGRDALRFEDIVLLDRSGVLGPTDRYRDMRLDIDNMSYEELLALEERIGNVSTGLGEETISKRLKTVRKVGVRGGTEEDEPCTICQEKYEEGDEVGVLDCGHEYHRGCIKQWLMQKNVCPICKTTSL